MPVPAYRTSRARKRKRRSHLALKRVQWVTCPLTNRPKLPHRACPESGYVRPGLQIEAKESD
jgi:large subunit ribosomal protein L32